MARQLGRFLGRLRLTTQGALDQLKEEADLKDINLPDLRVGSLRTQARDYVRELLDIEGQMAELEREREEIKASLEAGTEPNGSAPTGSAPTGTAGSVANGPSTHVPSAPVAEQDPAARAEPAPVDPDAT